MATKTKCAPGRVKGILRNSRCNTTYLGCEDRNTAQDSHRGKKRVFPSFVILRVPLWSGVLAFSPLVSNPTREPRIDVKNAAYSREVSTGGNLQVIHNSGLCRYVNNNEDNGEKTELSIPRKTNYVSTQAIRAHVF